MKNITVIGAGTAGLTFIERIREKGWDCQITLIDKNDYYFPKKDLISRPGDISGRIELKPWAEDKQIEFINDFVERVSLKRKKIYFRQTEARTFDTLVVATGLSSKKISVKGEHREGFFYLSQIDPFKLKDLLRISSEVTVYVSTWLGIKLALSIRALDKEVRLVGPSLDFLGEDKKRVLNFLQEKNILLHLNTSLEEAVGEGMIKAAKILPLKVFSSQMVFIDSKFSANRGFFEEEVVLRDTFFTDFENSYLLGDVTRNDIEDEFFFDSNYKEAQKQAGILAEYFRDKKAPVFARKHFGLEDKKRIVDSLLSEVGG